MTDATAISGRSAAASALRRPSRRIWLWLGVLIFMIILPWLFYDWHTGRQSGFVLSMLSQMGMMVIFALSYNMLMGQAGLLSFGHAVLFGLGGYCTIHFLNAAGDGERSRCRWNSSRWWQASPASASASSLATSRPRSAPPRLP